MAWKPTSPTHARLRVLIRPAPITVAELTTLVTPGTEVLAEATQQFTIAIQQSRDRRQGEPVGPESR